MTATARAHEHVHAAAFIMCTTMIVLATIRQHNVRLVVAHREYWTRRNYIIAVNIALQIHFLCRIGDLDIGLLRW